ncbi:MAG: flagellar brake protein [Gammaproteobacteria bacterium]|nr:flagellar brake protein [Gammaproteobacteria bacterium]
MSEIENLIKDPANEEFLIHTRSSIASVLRNLMREKRTISAYLPSGDMVATSILHVDAEKNMVILEPAQDAKLSRAFSNTHQVLFDLKHNSVIIQFIASSTQPARFNGASSVFIELPDTLLRLQRREYFRIDSDIGKMTVKLTDAGGVIHVLEVEDLSLGGIGTVVELPELLIKQFMVFEESEISIPGLGTLVVDLQVRNYFEKTLSTGQKVNRLGLAFMDLPTDKENQLQRFINKLQMEQQRRQKEED